MKISTSRKLLFTSLAIVFLSVLIGLIGGVFTNNPEVADWLKAMKIGPRELLIGIVIFALALLILAYFQFLYDNDLKRSAEKNLSDQDIEPDVKKFVDSLKERYKKRYEQKLDGRFEITLDVSESSDSRCSRRFDEKYENGGRISPASEYIYNAFDKKGRLLIIGNAGVGKTVLLLKLALNLLNQANISQKEAFPVIFNLVSWSPEKDDFNEWLISMLISGEGLSRDFATMLLQEQRIIPLLDGFDELARNEIEEIANKIRAKCLESVNDYLRNGRKIVICSRAEEFERINDSTGQLAPVSIQIIVAELTSDQVLHALERASNDKNIKYHASSVNIKKIVDMSKNSRFLQVLKTPFYFTSAMEIFDQEVLNIDNLRQIDANLISNNRLETSILKMYVAKKLKYGENPNHFEPEKVTKWLIWLARMMERKQIVSFELSHLQITDLSKDMNYLLVCWTLGLIMGFFSQVNILFSAALSGIEPVNLISNDPFSVVSYSVVIVLRIVITGFAYGSLLVILSKVFPRNKTEDIIQWVSDPIFSLRFWLKILAGSWVMGGSFGFIFFFNTLRMSWADADFDLNEAILVNLEIGFICGSFISVAFIGFPAFRKTVLFAGLSSAYMRLKAGFITGLLQVTVTFTILGTTVFYFHKWVHPREDVETNFFWFLGAITVFGLFRTPLFRHLMLRLALKFEKAVPWRYVMFLDYVASLGIMEKDGGIWRFRHQNLQEYFANLAIK